MPPVNWNFEPGDTIVPGRRAASLLGGGRRYEAWATWNERLLWPTVVKILRPDFVDDPRARKMIAAEATALRRCEHPSFSRLFDAEVDGDRPFLELEFLDGPRLSTLIRSSGVLVPEQLFPLARQLASALHYLHTTGTVHLDVKPGNVIMGPIPRLIDLSVARSFEQIPSIDEEIGTDAYMAPEQCDLALFGSIGPASDVWGLGVTLYEAASRQRPFPKGDREASGADRWPQLAIDAAPPPKNRVPPPVAQLIMSCLRRDPGARPTPLQLFDEFDSLATRFGVRPVLVKPR